MKKTSLEDFIVSPTRNQYIRFKNLETYYRKGPYFIDGIFYKKVLQRASTKNVKRPSNMEFKKKYKRTGQYRELDDLSFELAKKYEFDGILVECVLNDFLGDKLIEMGYKKVNIGTGDHYFKRVTE